MLDWGKTDLKFYEKNLRQIVFDIIPPKFSQVESMTRGYNYQL